MNARDLLLSPELAEEKVHAYLRGLGFSDPGAVDEGLQRMAGLFSSRERFAGLIGPLLERAVASADPEAAITQLETFFEVAPGTSTLLYFLEERRDALELLPRLLGASPYLSQLLVRNPEYFYWLFENDRLGRVEDRDYFLAQVRGVSAPRMDVEARLQALRRVRRRESLRIGAQDLLEIHDLDATVTQVSLLAEAILQGVFETLAPGLLSDGRGFAVIALGKLGGRELNFSSDIDLLYIFDEGAHRAERVRFARDYTRALNDYTDQGRLYRVDLRLRPMGQGGEIAYPIGAYRQYLETWADTFDRLALLKCRCAAGDPELGRRFEELAEEYVYKKYLDGAAVEEIRWLKKRTDRDMMVRDESRRNVKLGLGGIREIEFFVQAFQMLYGGRRPEIRTGNTREALDRLLETGFIGYEEHRTLRLAYLFLRDVEHKLQLVHDLQTHTLPRGEDELNRLARRLGFGDGQEPPSLFLQRELERQGKAVRRIFDSLFEAGEGRQGLEEVVLNPALGKAEVLERLVALGIDSAEEVYQGIRVLQEASSFPNSPSRMNNLLANLLPLLVEPLQDLAEPRRLFVRFDRFCEALGSRASLYTSLIEDASLRRRLLTLLDTGEHLVETLIRHPELLDTVERMTLPASGAEALHRLVEEFEAGGRSESDAIRLFHRREEFKVALFDLFEPEVLDCRRSLSDLAEICLEEACRRQLEEMPDLKQETIHLLALGKLGGGELTYHSDLDLMLVYDDRPGSAAASRWGEFLKGLRRRLESITREGRAYVLDFRLRPEGRHGPPATPRSALPVYFQGRARAWERLAYVKLRTVYPRGGDPPVDLRPMRRPLNPEEREELLHLRRRKEREIGRESEEGHLDFKVGRGGLMDVQFLIQALQLEHGVEEPGTVRALEILMERGILDRGRGEHLMGSLRFLLRLEAMRRLLEEKPTSRLPAAAEENRTAARLLGFNSGAELLEAYRLHTGRIREIFEKLW